MRDVSFAELFGHLPFVQSVEGRPDGDYGAWYAPTLADVRRLNPGAVVNTTRRRLMVAHVRSGRVLYSVPERCIAQRVYGDALRGFDVHHVDGNRFDHRLSNLAVLPKREHWHLHGYMKHGERWLREGDPERLRRDLRRICGALRPEDRRAKSLAIARSLHWTVTSFLGVAEFEPGVSPAHLHLLPSQVQRFLRSFFEAQRSLRVLVHRYGRARPALRLVSSS